MLVLSRRANEKLIFPGFQTAVHVVSMKNGTVRLGVDAPPHVEVFREEVLPPGALERLAEARPTAAQQALHQINNRLNAGGIGMALLQRQLELGRTDEMAATIAKLQQEFAALKQCVDAAGPKPAPEPSDLAARKALLVEDDPNECELLAGFLRLAGMDVTCASDGADALDYLRTNGGRPDVMLVDMILPRTDGPSTIRAVRGDPACAGLKIFGMTGADPRRFNLPQGDGGVDHWFHKPLNPHTLLAELARVIK